MIEITLSNSLLKAQIDDLDYALVKKFNWMLDGGYARTSDRSKIQMHNLLVTGYEKHRKPTDHKDGNKLNNQRYNLVISTVSRNAQGCRRRGNSSKFVGVSFIAKDNSYQVQIKRLGRSHYIGRFKTELEAALAYNKSALEIYGSEARLNKI